MQNPHWRPAPEHEHSLSTRRVSREALRAFALRDRSSVRASRRHESAGPHRPAPGSIRRRLRATPSFGEINAALLAQHFEEVHAQLVRHLGPRAVQGELIMHSMLCQGILWCPTGRGVTLRSRSLVRWGYSGGQGPTRIRLEPRHQLEPEEPARRTRWSSPSSTPTRPRARLAPSRLRSARPGLTDQEQRQREFKRDQGFPCPGLGLLLPGACPAPPSFPQQRSLSSVH